jgi:hypothetical protein
MEIVIEPHTLKRAEERGTNAEEIKTVLEEGVEIPARGNRKAKARSLFSNENALESITRRNESKSFTLRKKKQSLP